jgi:hypothetical protein
VDTAALLPNVPVSVDSAIRPHRLSTLLSETNTIQFPERTLNCSASLSTSDNVGRPSAQILFQAEEIATRSGDLSDFADRGLCTHIQATWVCRVLDGRYESRNTWLDLWSSSE